MSSRVLANRYELLEQIGEGGMAVVYKARCRVLNRFVAIKILKPEFTKDLKLVENFKKESHAAASLVHPNIVGVYDVGKEGNINYIVMELVKGEILSDIIKSKGALDYKKAIDIAQQIARGLSCAHKNHIIHKDVKPHNILITNDGIAKITDFGIAKFIDNATIVGDTDIVMGSVHYFSPEQARGGYVDEKSDIYSLGIVLYEMITGSVPFDGENPVTVALKHINDEIILPSKIVNGVPPALEKIIMKATDKIQVNRYKSAVDMANALKNVESISNIVGDKVYLGAGRGDFATTESNPEKVSNDNNPSGIMEKNGKEIATEMKKNGEKKFKINKVKVAAIIIALICAIPVSGLIFNFVSGFTSETEITVPDLTGKTIEEATVTLTDLGLQIKTGDKVYDNSYNSGAIISQLPIANSKVKEGNTITVNISKGSKEGTIPNLVGKAYGDAVFLIEKYGFKTGTVTLGKSEMPKDVVISQSPKAGEEASPGSKIEFMVSEGIAEGEVIMPLIVGKNVDKVTTELQNLGLAVGDVGYEMSEKYEKGQVMWQQYGSGELVDEGSKINIKVSTGDEPPAPKAIALDIDYKSAANLVFFLTVTVSDESGTHNVISREQRLKDDLCEVVSLSGTGVGTVTVIFDNDVVIKKNVNFNTGVID